MYREAPYVYGIRHMPKEPIEGAPEPKLDMIDEIFVMEHGMKSTPDGEVPDISITVNVHPRRPVGYYFWSDAKDLNLFPEPLRAAILAQIEKSPLPVGQRKCLLNREDIATISGWRGKDEDE